MLECRRHDTGLPSTTTRRAAIRQPIGDIQSANLRDWTRFGRMERARGTRFDSRRGSGRPRARQTRERALALDLGADAHGGDDDSLRGRGALPPRPSACYSPTAVPYAVPIPSPTTSIRPITPTYNCAPTPANNTSAPHPTQKQLFAKHQTDDTDNTTKFGFNRMSVPKNYCPSADDGLLTRLLLDALPPGLAEGVEAPFRLPERVGGAHALTPAAALPRALKPRLARDPREPDPAAPMTLHIRLPIRKPVAEESDILKDFPTNHPLVAKRKDVRYGSRAKGKEESTAGRWLDRKSSLAYSLPGLISLTERNVYQVMLYFYCSIRRASLGNLSKLRGTPIKSPEAEAFDKLISNSGADSWSFQISRETNQALFVYVCRRLHDLLSRLPPQHRALRLRPTRQHHSFCTQTTPALVWPRLHAFLAISTNKGLSQEIREIKWPGTFSSTSGYDFGPGLERCSRRPTADRLDTSVRVPTGTLTKLGPGIHSPPSSHPRAPKVASFSRTRARRILCGMIKILVPPGFRRYDAYLNLFGKLVLDDRLRRNVVPTRRSRRPEGEHDSHSERTSNSARFNRAMQPAGTYGNGSVRGIRSTGSLV
ncbi:hypothetical protein C8R43DRAFT_1140756 [Mycena crocata]|nr:hypothetical protein C8R43DRAFT_1140756 [Mycena crocata]